MLCRHASLADSLLSAWVITSGARMNPRYVLKRELLADPCLDIVGNRLPNHFLDRNATDSSESSTRCAARGRAARRPGRGHLPRGHPRLAEEAHASAAKISERDPERGQRLATCSTCCRRARRAHRRCSRLPAADVVVAWHVGFDGLDTFGGILRHLARRPRPVQFHAHRIARADVPDGDRVHRWLDDVATVRPSRARNCSNPKEPR
jgi:hypothetical protein